MSGWSDQWTLEFSTVVSDHPMITGRDVMRCVVLDGDGETLGGMDITFQARSAPPELIEAIQMRLAQGAMRDVFDASARRRVAIDSSTPGAPT